LGGDQTTLVESFEYDAGFGGCCVGAPTSVGSNSFATKVIDAPGNVTLYSYDARGNRIHTQHRIPSITEDFGYNVYGQPTSHVHPDNGSAYRRRDVFTYYDAGPQRGYRAQEVVDASALHLTTTFDYDPVGNIIRMIDPRGHDTFYTYNALDQLLGETSREVMPDVRYRRDFYYEANNNVVREDIENRDESGALQPNARFSAIFDYEILNQVI